MFTTWSTSMANARHEGDAFGGKVFSLLKSDNNLHKTFYQALTNEHLSVLSESFKEVDLSREYALPSWTDQERLIRASLFFRKYTREILAVLGMYALPYCYAGAKGVRVLYHSRKIREQPSRRLLETAQFVLDVCDEGAFDNNGKALISILRVRVMHAAARFYSRDLIKDEVAVNQEDMLATILAFSLIVIRGLRKLGIQVSPDEAVDYLHLWSVTGALMGIKEEYLPHTVRDASNMERYIRHKEFRESEKGKLLTRSLLGYFNQQGPDELKKPEKIMTYLLGNEVAKCLGLKPLSSFAIERIRGGSFLVNAIRGFSEDNYQQLLKEFERNLLEQKLTPTFKFS